jgi:cytochrome P450
MTNEFLKDLQDEVNELVYEASKWSFNRRDLISKGAALTIGTLGLSIGCKTTGSNSAIKETDQTSPRNVRIEFKKFNKQKKDFDVSVIMVTGSSIYYDYDQIILQELRVTEAPSATNNEFKYQVVQHATAAASLISFYLENEPYKILFPELIAKRQSVAVFRPSFGPYIVFRHQDVIDVLIRPEVFTVDPYAPNMSVATSGHPSNGHDQPPDLSDNVPADELEDYQPQWKPAENINPDGKQSYYNHYMLGVDQDDLYIPDSRIARYVVSKEDIPMLRPMIRRICEGLVSGITPGSTFDVVKTIGRYAPVSVIMEYLGFPSFEKGKAGKGDWNITQNGKPLHGGGKFLVPQSFQNRFRFQKLEKDSDGKMYSIVPDRAQAYEWIRDNFRMIFNNFGNNAEFTTNGLVANERLLAWSALVIEFFKAKIEAGQSVPDTMITRLIKLQKNALADKPKFAAIFGCTEEDLVLRVGDDRIQVNAFGAFVGAVANPEEANGRIIEELLRIKSGEREVINGSYAEAKKAAMNDDTATLNKYVVELLRLNPQGEILLRRCIEETKLRSGEGIPKGTTVFAAHGAAMRDPDRIPDGEKFDSKRADRTQKYKYDSRKDPNSPDKYVADHRADDDEQSLIYLHHGFGRHKCLGRYASEITMEEVLRAVLRLGDISRVDERMKMDKENLYATSFQIKVS